MAVAKLLGLSPWSHSRTSATSSTPMNAARGHYRRDDGTPGIAWMRVLMTVLGLIVVLQGFGLPMLHYYYFFDRWLNPLHPRFLDKQMWQGWAFGRRMDNSDPQWNGFRTCLPFLFGGMFIYFILSRVFDPPRDDDDEESSDESSESDEGEKETVLRRSRRLRLIIPLGILIAVTVHGVTSFWLFLMTFLSYGIIRSFPRSIVMPWVVFVISLAFYVYSDSLRFAHIGLPYLDECPWPWRLGLIVFRWEIVVKLFLLRIVSYAWDFYWSKIPNRDFKPSGDLTQYKLLMEKNAPFYDFLHYFAYIFYVPLYFVGPFCSYNAWCSQLYHRQREYNMFQIIARLFVAVIEFVVLEMTLHLWAFNAAIVNRRFWEGNNSPFMVSALQGYATFTYFKLLIIWRMARCFGLIDGIDSPESMTRCVCRYYSVRSMWRTWNVSVSQWSIRYLYVPLGGRKYRVFSILFVFVFFGIWHEVSLRWVLWGVFNCFCLVLEVVVSELLRRSSLGKWLPRHRFLWDVIQSLGAVGGVFCIMSANLVAIVKIEEYLPALKHLWFGPDSPWMISVLVPAIMIGVHFEWECQRFLADRVQKTKRKKE